MKGHKNNSGRVDHGQEQASFNQEFPYKVSENHSVMLPTSHSKNRDPLPRDKDLSLRSVSTHKKSHLSRLSYDNEPTESQISEAVRSNYQAIERILKSENANLKQQNVFLLGEIQKLKSANRKYKETCLGQRIELEALREECEAQKKRADDMKEIIMTRLVSLEQKALGHTEALTAQDREELIYALNHSGITSQEDS